MSEILKNQQIYDLLDSKGIAYDKMQHAPAHTWDNVVEFGLTEKGIVCKNLFMRDFKGKNHFLLSVPGEKKVDLKSVSEKIGSSKLSFGSAERLMKYLGVEQGSVSPFGILNDESKSVVMVFDSELKGQPIGIHPNDNTATLWINFESLCELIKEHGNEIMLIDL